MRTFVPKPAQRGVTLIELLVSLIILAVGLLGTAALQARLQMSEMEAYQRSQALILLNDMAHRIAVNRNNAIDYVTGTDNPLGVGMTNCPAATSTSTRQQIDAKEWCEALQGAAETIDDARVGAMVGGRGCIENLGSGSFQITVAWQGTGPISAPPDSVACGKNSYDGEPGSSCKNDLCRRTVTTVVRVATL
ncbi:type IV pilus modification protein PilV [Marinimicrobium sp. ABcell2]|uniref:type IV pilus modification protein PilV n=1 Tax=Marinimicrobium sp. ABcell2 TaxID=3069751 RepID=UPI0027AE9ABF|nr:type IV pilus modification protein PilV [Marinimicrobium sp. ABcell2]MDQ2075642.1 type IV pilus modification protein PilV [Marinimicrobium sp. ABcell2]